MGLVLEELAALAYKEARNGFTFQASASSSSWTVRLALAATGDRRDDPDPGEARAQFRIAKQAKDSTLAKRGK